MCDSCKTVKYITLSDDQLPQLRDRLKDNIRYIKVYSELCTQLDGIFKGFEFIVDSWPNFKVVIAKPSPSMETDILKDNINIGGEDPAAVTELLKSNDIIDWRKGLMFSFVDTKLEPAINDLISKHGGTANTVGSCYVMEATRESLQTLPNPEGCQAKPLTQEDCDLVNKHWQFAVGDVTQKYIRTLITTRPSCCLYNSEGSVLGFALCYHYGCIGFLHVMEDQRAKGYGKFITSYLANECLTRGMRAMVVVENNNMVSLKLHEGVGFEKIPDFQVSWIRYAPKGCCSGPKSCCI